MLKDKIVLVYANKAGNLLIFREGDNGVLYTIREVEVTEMINAVADFINQPGIIRLNTGINEAAGNNGDSLSGIYFTKDFIESDYIHFNFTTEQYDVELNKQVATCGVYVLFKNRETDPDAHRQLTKLGIYKNLKSFLNHVLNGTEDPGLEESILLRHEVIENWE